MQLSTIEIQIGHQIGRFEESVGRVKSGSDRNAVHRAINLAVNELKWNTIIDSVLKDLTPIPLVTGTQNYSLDSDFDIPVRIAIQTSSGEGELKRIYAQNLLKRIATTIDTGTPEWYRPFGSVSNLIQLRTYPIYAGTPSGASIIGEYIPILEDLSSDTDENQFTIRYPNSVIKIGTEIAYHSLVDHKTPPLQNTIVLENLVKREADKIMQHELSGADQDTKFQVSDQIRRLRRQRFTQ